METNNSLVPMDLQSAGNKVSKWSQPGGTLAKVLTAVAAGGGIYALYLALPVILSMMTNAFSIACFAIGLWALVSLVTNKHFRKMLSTGLFVISRKITSWFIEIDPISIIRRHTEELNDRVEKIGQSMGNFRGAIRSLEQEKAKSEKELKTELELLEVYKQKGMINDSTVHGNQAVRLRDLISEYEADLKKVNLYYNMLKDLQHYTKLRVQDEKNQCDVLERKFKRTREMYNAFSGMMSIINSDTNDIDEYLMATSLMQDQISAQMGHIDDALLSTDSIINDINITKSLNIAKAAPLLDIYEQYGIDGLFMTDEERKALPSSATGTISVSSFGVTDTDKELLYAEKNRQQILGENANTRKYV